VQKTSETGLHFVSSNAVLRSEMAVTSTIMYYNVSLFTSLYFYHFHYNLPILLIILLMSLVVLTLLIKQSCIFGALPFNNRYKYNLVDLRSSCFLLLAYTI
jgi:hypothetical protein